MAADRDDRGHHTQPHDQGDKLLYERDRRDLMTEGDCASDQRLTAETSTPETDRSRQTGLTWTGAMQESAHKPSCRRSAAHTRGSIAVCVANSKVARASLGRVIRDIERTTSDDEGFVRGRRENVVLRNAGVCAHTDVRFHAQVPVVALSRVSRIPGPRVRMPFFVDLRAAISAASTTEPVFSINPLAVSVAVT